MKKTFFTEQKVFKTKDKVLENKNIQILSKMGLSDDFYTVLCKDNHNNQYVLKIRKEKSRTTRQGFLTEIHILKQLSRQKDIGLLVPEYLSSNTYSSPEWLIYKFSEGSSIGWWSGFEEWFTDKHIKKLPKIVSSISKVTINSNKIKKISYNQTIKIFNKRKNILKKYLSSEQIKKGSDILKKNKQIFNKANFVLTHGDLHPGNIVLNKKDKLVVIDWFNAHLNNAAFDPCFVWFSLWGYPEEQKEFLDEITQENSKQKGFKKLFSLNQIILTPKFLEIMDNIKKEIDPDSEEHEDVIEAEGFFVKTYKEVLRDYEK
ncbi:MAG: aminoglycoside phosphotransferase family protein [Patescibacteria group bacterium]